MLLQLNIKNFALIESLSISFSKGFNVLSGETGAGKSILIDAINYVLGVKFTKNLIRTGETKTFVEAIFTLENEKTVEALKKLDIDYEDMVIISRETFQSGKSIAKINGKTVLLSNVKLVSSTLIDIHGQHENQSLLDPEKHIFYLDNYGEEDLKLAQTEYYKNYYLMLEIDKKINDLKTKTGDKEKIIDFLKYQIEEIDSGKLKIGEDVDLEEKYSIISNSENISKVLCESYEKLYGSNNESKSIYDELSVIVKELRSIEKHSDKIMKISDSLEEVYFIIEQNVSEIRRIIDTIEFDDKELEYINNRIYQIDQLKKKYGKSINDILTYKNKISNEYEELIHCSEIIEELVLKRSSMLNKVLEQAEIIHNKRIEIAKILEHKILNELKYIGLEKSVFNINIKMDEKNLSDTGADKIQFYISTNPGEPLKPLEKVVSGGELSRIMLALKTVFVDKDNIPSVIFDEIDTGISGRVAQSVAEKMYSISNNHQVFCITHLPQIACMSDVHYLVKKQVDNNKTYTIVTELSNVEKQNVLAQMIGGSEVTKLTLDHSEEMIIMANNKKEKLKRNAS